MHLTVILMVVLAVQDTRPGTGGITILNTAKGGSSTNYKNYDAGPSVGDMLKYHYFPALEDYSAGRYSHAAGGASYVINAPHYLDANPRKTEFLSTSHYIRGMVYLHHAVGVGRHSLAKEDFEAAIRYNPKNFSAYLELSRVYSQLKMTEPAISVLRHLLDRKPDAATVEQVHVELKKLGALPDK